MTQAATTTEHDVIRQWVNSRGGWPAKVKSTDEGRGTGIVQIDFPGYSGEDSLERISWEEFFQAFEDNELAFLFQEKLADGSESRMCKLVSRN